VVALPHVIALDHLRQGELRAAGAIALLPLVFTPLLVFRALRWGTDAAGAWVSGSLALPYT
jgi:hypothetical protein